MDRKDFQTPAYILPVFPDEDFACDVMGRFRLPVDHFTLAQVHIDAATRFITGSPDDHSPEVKAKLGEDLYTLIDVTHNGIKLTDEHFQYMWYVLQIRAVALLLRHTIFGDPSDLRMYDNQSRSLGPWSEAGRDTFVDSCYRAIGKELPNSSRNLPPSSQPFAKFVNHTHQIAEELMGTPAESRDPIHQAQLIDSLTTIIETLDHAVVYRAPGDQAVDPIAWKRFVQGVSYYFRFSFTGNLTDLDSSIPLLETAVRLSDPSDPEEVSTTCFRGLMALVRRFHHTQDPIDLNSVIETAERYLLLPQSTRGGLAISEQLYGHLILRLRIRRNAADSEHVLQLGEEILSTASGERLSEYLRVAEHAIGVIFSLDSNIEGPLSRSPPISDEMVADLDDTIETFKARCLSYLPGNDTERQATALMLLLLHLARYTRYLLIQDLRDAIGYRMSLRSQPLGTFCLDLPLLRMSLDDRDPVGMNQRLVEAQRSHCSICQCDCDGDQVASAYKGTTWLNDQPVWRGQRRLERLGSQFVPCTIRLPPFEVLLSFDIDNFIADSATSTELETYRMRLLYQIYDHHWGGAPRHQEDQCKRVEEYSERLYSSFQTEDRSYGTRRWRKDWAQALLGPLAPQGAVPLPRHQLALDHLREFAFDYHHAPLDERLVALNYWFKHLPRVRAEKKGEVLEMGELTLSLLQEQSEAASSAQALIDSRLRTQGLLLEVVSEAMFTELGTLERGVELLLWGQSILWDQLERARGGFRAGGSPAIEERLEGCPSQNSLVTEEGSTLSRNKEGSGVKLTGMGAPENHEIPRPPGLYKSKLLWNQLKEFTRLGPVVLLIPGSPSSIALLFAPLFPTPLRCFLPISKAEVNKLHEVLQFSVQTRGDGQLSQHDTTDCGDSSDSEPLVPSEDSTESDPRSLRRNLDRVDRSVDIVLERLWQVVVEPVLRSGFARGCVWDAKEPLTTLVKPSLRNRTRIWWCPLGEFSFLPVHAAGIYKGASPMCASDFFVSSYTPSLEALIDARKRPHPARSEYKVLAAIQPNPGCGWSRLPGVRNELEEVLKVVPEKDLIHLGDSKEPDLEGIHTTVENLVNKLPEANILHLACHGTQDVNNPLESGFILANGERLTIEELTKLHLPKAHTAILTACHTASNDAVQPEESINLTSAMLFLGFRSVLGTKWPMCDADGPTVSRTVYSKLTNWSEGASSSPLMPLEYFCGVFENIYASIRPEKLGLLGSHVVNDWTDLRNKLARHFADCLQGHDNEPLPYDEMLEAVRGGFALVSPDSEPVLDSEVEATVATISRELYAPSLAHIVDEIARDLRVNKKLPASRWATFVHFGA